MTGRDEDLRQVMQKLSAAPTIISGVGGLGKSRLAAELPLGFPRRHNLASLWPVYNR